MKLRTLTTLCMTALAFTVATGCAHKGGAERAGEKIDNAADKTSDSVRDGTEKAGDKIEDATDKH